jgi:excisionase family DNA binding protein
MAQKLNGILTTQQAADELGLTRRSVQLLCKTGKLRHERFGHDYAIRRTDLESVRVRPKGRPRTRV